MPSKSSTKLRSELLKQREFREEKKHANGLSKNIIHSVVKLEEMGSHLDSMHRKLEAACMGEAQVITNAEVKIAELKKNHEAAVKELKAKANSQIQWFYKEFNLDRSQNEWLRKELNLAWGQAQVIALRDWTTRFVK